MTWNTPPGNAFNLCLDMAKQPHILIAGSTGSGKSVLVNSFIYTCLYNAPCQVQFILIDPKRVELSDYKPLPHTIIHAKTETDILQALNGAARLMLERFTRMEKNRLKQSTEPHIYVVIDEWIDIKLKIGRAAEKPLIDIASMGRAANIHIILCTQRPTGDIINGAIKANFTSKIALRTDRKQESRNILDVSCAELLPLYGYGYYKTPATKQPQLIQVPFTPPEQITERVNFWLEQTPKRYKYPRL